MGVDFMTCSNEKCGYNFPDCGEYFTCGCERNFCSDECAESKEIKEGDPLYNAENERDNVTCLYCRGDAVSDANLLGYALTCLDTDRERFTKQYVELQRAVPPCASMWCRHIESDHSGANGACERCPTTEKREYLWCKGYRKPERL